MTEFVGWVSDLLALEIGTLGTTAVTLGYLIAAFLVAVMAFAVIRRIKGRS